MGKIVKNPRKMMVSTRLTRAVKEALKLIARRRAVPLTKIIRERPLRTRLGE